MIVCDKRQNSYAILIDRGVGTVRHPVRLISQSPLQSTIMAASLHKPFINLSLSTRQSLDNKPKIPSRMRLSIPQIDTQGRCMYYGFDVTEEWMIEYAKAEYGRVEYNPDPPPSDFDLLTVCFPMLSNSSGIRTLKYKSVYDQGAHIPPRTNQQTLPLPKPGVHIIAICSSLPGWFERRPHQAQVDKLKEIMGGKEPKWWVAKG
jgi:hypothetical protein